MKKAPLARLLQECGLAESKRRAEALILAGKVFVNGTRVDKPGTPTPLDAKLALRGLKVWASRGAHKLLGALEAFATLKEALQGADCLDIGASTGGFTDVMLKHGADRVIALDVGYGLLHERLRQDPRVHILDRTNVRHIVPGDLPFAPNFLTVDTSFISVTRFLDVCHRELAPGGFAIILVKPQFELPRDQVGEGGVVRDEAGRQAALAKVQKAAQASGFTEVGAVDSDLAGPKGNREFLLVLNKP